MDSIIEYVMFEGGVMKYGIAFLIILMGLGLKSLAFGSLVKTAGPKAAKTVVRIASSKSALANARRLPEIKIEQILEIRRKTTRTESSIRIKDPTSYIIKPLELLEKFNGIVETREMDENKSKRTKFHHLPTLSKIPAK